MPFVDFLNQYKPTCIDALKLAQHSSNNCNVGHTAALQLCGKGSPVEQTCVTTLIWRMFLISLVLLFQPQEL